uniref:Uncharacterized protein n=1 Tax=Amphimedon queenslandica TaxID=400682 RepID=A0A1X7VV47_AMPQE
MSRDWKHGIFGCFGDCSICLLSFFCPCYVIGKNAEAVGERCCLYCCLSFIPFINFWCSVAIRSRIRAQKGIDGTCCSDVLCTLCFPFCALTQAAREVQETPTGLYMLRE